MAFITKRKLQPKGSTFNSHLDVLAHDHFGIQRFYALGFDESNQIGPLFNTPTEISYFGWPSRQEKDQLLKQAVRSRGLELMREIKDQLNNSHNGYALAHFVCNVRGREGGHWILLSLVQNSSGRALYIFDNTNELVTERSQAKRYIDYLCETLSVSPRKQFKGPRLPDEWRTTPQRKTRFVHEGW